MRYGGRHRGGYKSKYRGQHGMNLSEIKYCRKNLRKVDNLSTIIGKIMILIGIILVFKNTMIYSGSSITRGISFGTSCWLAFILVMIGIITLVCNKNKSIGWSIVFIGVICFIIGIIINMKMIFMPMNLLKTIMLFGFIAVGISIMIKDGFKRR